MGNISLRQDDLIANWYQANKVLADAILTTALDLTGNTYILGHSLLTWMTLTALGKDVKPKNSRVTTVSLLFTFASHADKDHFNTIGRTCSIPINHCQHEYFVIMKS